MLDRLPQSPSAPDRRVACRRAHSWLLSLLLRSQPLAEAQLQHCTDYYLMFAYAVSTLPSPSEVCLPQPQFAATAQIWSCPCRASPDVLSGFPLLLSPVAITVVTE